ncbi:hypothetical protein EDB92DRAFT_1815010 [Lactarius akahatsu]|uniref:N-acetyltransferase domain-containing protein n=1 Tax=Lactarius akahatsu TaxID=416441 RepID=A0AAD4LKY2_9AGAM|nr:hypothetical protein EDB92DRAFT_1815010 [Lactarius akahatsu]
MSAYGTFTAPSRPTDLLPPTVWELPEPTEPDKPAAPFRRLALHHLRLDDARALLPGLVEYTHRVFAAEVEAGRSYPQEAPHTRAAFEAYFWAADVIVAIGTNDQSGSDSDSNVEGGRAGRSWEDALVGFYYVKPNYPGRSSHICNAGFVIPASSPAVRLRQNIGKIVLALWSLARIQSKRVQFGSMRIWDSLGFVRAGLIPRAGRLRREDGSGEEWFDAVIYYRSFVDEDEWARPIE